MSRRELIFRNLRHWTPHVLMNASGAFCYAVMAQWHNPQAVTGMLGGIVAFIALYSFTTSSEWFQRWFPADSLPSRALLYATRLRSSLGVLGAMLAVVLLSWNLQLGEPLKGLLLLLCLLLMPDALAGGVAIGFLQFVGKSAAVHSFRSMVAGSDAHQRAQSLLVGDLNSLTPTFLITLLDGLLLSLMLLVLTWIF